MDREKRVLELLRQMIAINSETATEKEQAMEVYLLHVLSKIKENVWCGSLPVRNDSLGRSVVYGFIEGRRADTLIFMNHHDVVGCEAYGKLAPYSFSPEILAEKLRHSEIDLETETDLDSNEWLFGRGACDMKGGIAAQLTVFEEYAAHPGNMSLLFLSVPDEESYSAGMRSALPFLQQLQKERNLRYRLLVNCEPNHKEQDNLIAYTGSVGKLLPVVLVQGKAVHISKYAEGINPLGILARLVSRTEGNWNLADQCEGESTPPPSWMYLRDEKKQYDFSLPWRASAYASFLTFKKTPEEVLRILKKETQASIKAALAQARIQYEVPVLSYEELLNKAKHIPGFFTFYNTLQYIETEKLKQGGNYPSVTIDLMAQILDFMEEREPVVIIGFAPPYYPAVDSRNMGDKSFHAVLQAVTTCLPVRFDQYFIGVSDCSYCGLDSTVDSTVCQDNMPLWGEAYQFDLKALSDISIPFILLGPWGKDLHCRTERVHISSVSRVLPCVLRQILTYLEKNY
jgi:arginine utilization protein RocB